MPEKRPLGVKDYDFLFKIVLLGDNGVGKTTLLRAYTEKCYHTSVLPHESADLETKIIERRNKKVKLHIWDTAGLERFQSLTRSYYRNARGCVVLFDVNNELSFHNAIKWLSDAQKYCSPKTRIILAATKCNETPSNRIISRARAENLARELEVPYMEVSSQRNINVNELFETLTDTIMDDMRGRALKLAQNKRHPLITTISLKDSLKKELKELRMGFSVSSMCSCG